MNSSLEVECFDYFTNESLGIYQSCKIAQEETQTPRISPIITHALDHGSLTRITTNELFPGRKN